MLTIFTHPCYMWLTQQRSDLPARRRIRRRRLLCSSGETGQNYSSPYLTSFPSFIILPCLFTLCRPLLPYHHYARADDAHQYMYCLPSPPAAWLASHTSLYPLAPMAMSVSERTRRVVPVVQGIADFEVQRRLWCPESVDLEARKCLCCRGWCLDRARCAP